MSVLFLLPLTCWAVLIKVFLSIANCEDHLHVASYAFNDYKSPILRELSRCLPGTVNVSSVNGRPPDFRPFLITLILTNIIKCPFDSRQGKRREPFGGGKQLYIDKLIASTIDDPLNASAFPSSFLVATTLA
jgi:hypothetical protein